MPWMSIIMFILSFFLSKKSGMSTGKSALVGAAAGLGTWLSVDPSNEDAWFKPFHDEPNVSPGLAGGQTVPNPNFDPSKPEDPETNPPRIPAQNTEDYKSGAGSSFWPSVGTTIGSLGSSAADVAKSWGASGTTGAIIAGSNADKIGDALGKIPTWMFVGGGLLITYWIIKD